MAYRVVRKFEKTSQQDWSGVTFNIQKALDPTPDPRDVQFNQITEIKNAAKEYAHEVRTSLTGYIGANREYEDDNTLNIIFHFNTYQDALNFVNLPYASNSAVKTFADIVREKQEQNQIPIYTITTTILDESGNVITP